MPTITLQPFTTDRLHRLWEIGYRQAAPRWKEFAAPYFDDYHAYARFEDFQAAPLYQWLQKEAVRAILLDDQPIGFVSYYWECQPTRWLEVGIEIHDDSIWGKGYGTTALKIWLNMIFDQFPDLEHIGLTTWSGNPGMMRAAEKLGMTKEAQIRKVRYWQGHYYDSVKYGIIREEWLEQKKKSSS
ncbi:TPA: GNAT family N-acetyltransferase [Streptococcus suis]|uniref:GNAT family N-acetyltransferase n=1 Tax=Streptococcus suis TaxID=1307 RepID=A0A4T2GLC7_STRSU|nr:GNAT family N-acetyltransferase [Streptococcus suis]MBM7269958.1 GNAT family N-acetyltransferase [Streptococcus suis]TIH99845.1 GNAT family N-acetyltransferase [Streptococcus suis]HEL1585706.1 GNAT family N-acetyltransferase [Streptococcus suis]